MVKKKTPAKKPTKRKTRGKSQDWSILKKEFIHLNLDADPISLKEFSEKKGLAHGTVRNKAAEDSWLQDLEERLDLKHTKEIAEYKKAHERAMLRLKSMAVNEEVSVRNRHANAGRTLQVRSMLRFQAITDDEAKKIKIPEALQMMRLGAELERAALGLADKLEPGNPLTNPHEAIDEATRTSLNTEDVDAALADVLEALLNDRTGDPDARTRADAEETKPEGEAGPETPY